MPPKLTKAQAQAFRKRWQLINARELEEMRTTSMEIKRRQFNTPVRWAKAVGWTEALAKDDEKVRERWMCLRKAYRDKKKFLTPKGETP